MKAIETSYKNIIFRSNLEASYAKTFDSLGIEWEYEIEGYQIDDIRYLPDFWLPQIKTVLEVKGPLVPGAEKAEALAKSIKNPDWWNQKILVLIGDEKGSIKLAEDRTDVALAQCAECDKYWFMPWSSSYVCRNCGKCDGDHHIKKSYDKLTLQRIKIRR